MGFYGKLTKILAIIVIVIFSKNILASEQATDTIPNKDINNILDQSRKEYNLPGISLSIKLPINDNIKDYVSGYYSLSSGRKITPETLFQIGSITKTFTATIVFKLIEEHILSGDDNLEKWLPQYTRWKNITIYNLLRHTSGVYNYTSGKSFDNLLNKNPLKYWSMNQLADMAYTHVDLFSPGKKSNYTNTDYILLGMIIEKATNKSLQQVFDGYLKQYDLNNTYYSPSPYSNTINNQIAHGYNRDGTFKFNTDVTFVSTSYSQSAGAVISTPHDVIKWLNDLFSEKIINNTSLMDMTKIISEESAQTIDINELNAAEAPLKSKSFTEVGIGSGIGLIYLKNNGFTWVHAGGMPGYESFFVYSPCNGIYLALAYNVKPKQQLIFIQIANEIFKKLNSYPEVVKAIEIYQKNNILPTYCHTKLNGMSRGK